MALKVPRVTEAKGSDSETFTTIDLGFSDISGNASAKEAAKREAGEFIIESILDAVGSQKSPVSGEEWPALKSGNYRKQKRKEVGNTRANMELTGAMLDSLEFRETTDGVQVGFFDEQAAKADGHNKLSGRNNRTPKRRFLPRQGQKFKFRDDIKDIVIQSFAQEQEFSESDFQNVQSKTSLFNVLRKRFQGLSDREIEVVVLRTPSISNILERRGLLRFFRGAS